LLLQHVWIWLKGSIMKSMFVVAALAFSLAGCTTYSGGDGVELEPIPGSITYGGQPRSRLTKSPIGSRVPHEFRNQWGERVHETYILQPDRSLRLVERHVLPEPIWD
jgi:hypothetical protein